MSTLLDRAHVSNPQIQALIHDIAAQLTAVLGEACGGQFRTLEETILQVTSEATRLSLESALQSIASSFGKGDRILVNGQEYKSHHQGKVGIPSLCGKLVVKRYTFRETGTHNGATAVPMDLVAGLVEGVTPVLAENIVHGCASRDMREHRKALILARRVPPSRASLERLATRYGAIACGAPAALVETIRRVERNPKGARAISFGVDRTSVAMVEPRDPDGGTAPRRKRVKPRCCPRGLIRGWSAPFWDVHKPVSAP